MNITILCTSETHPVNEMLLRWVKANQATHQIKIARRKDELNDGDLLFLISCTEVILEQQRSRFKKTLVIHASDLPRGRGWSPHIWELVNGAKELTVSLLEAEDSVDSGDIWKQVHVNVPKHCLHNEINNILFCAEFELMDFAVKNFHRIVPTPQDTNIDPTYYPRRQAMDSELDPRVSVEKQFDLLRVSDPVRFPAFFKLYGFTYKLKIEKIKDE